MNVHLIPLQIRGIHRKILSRSQLNAEDHSGSLSSYLPSCRYVNFITLPVRRIAGCCIGINPTTSWSKLDAVHGSSRCCTAPWVLARAHSTDEEEIHTLVDLWSNEPDCSVAHLQTRTIPHVPFAPEVVLLHKLILNWEFWRRFRSTCCGCISLGLR